MDIKAIPDIVLEVSRAASPSSQSTAVARLASEAGSKVPNPSVAKALESDWSIAVTRATQATEPVGTTSVALAGTPLPVSGPHINSAGDRKTPAMQFEAFVLQTFVEAMLPKEADGVFGGGTSGDIWRSMLAEHIATEVARSGNLGIANLIEKAPA